MGAPIPSYDLWNSVDKFREILLREQRVKCVAKTFADQYIGGASSAAVSADAQNSYGMQDRNKVLKKLETIIEDILSSLAHNESPVLSYESRRTWENVQFTEDLGLEMRDSSSRSEIRFDSFNSVNKFAMTLRVLAMCYKLVQSNTYSTKRDMYYNDTQLFGSQAVLDDIVDNIACMLQVPRWRLHVLATSKGCIAGDLQFTEVDGNHVDCSTTASGVLVPAHVNGITNIQSKAKFVLVVEKDATFQKLLDDGLCHKLAPCIIITGKGFPDVNTRLMVRKLWDTLQIPIFGLVDADPHGLDILFVYKFGSRSLSYDSHNLTVPVIRWLGVLPSDIERLQVPRDVLIPLSKADMDKANELMKRPYYNAMPHWMKEVQVMLHSGVKAEIQCLAAISSNYLTNVYIPSKLQYGGWI
ncbi:meiotic recombination protein SPO11-like [Amphiura filiformis]|uniref:meiotic recombination protein SPO11-like n=1 Tax=Amphiura filiformis TaxID=82378 RepID=UPI003B228286